MVITLPIHPLAGLPLPVIRHGCGAGGRHLVVETPDGQRLGVPIDWTDLRPAVGGLTVGDRRPRLVADDLLRLTAWIRERRLVALPAGAKLDPAPGACKIERVATNAGTADESCGALADHPARGTAGGSAARLGNIRKGDADAGSRGVGDAPAEATPSEDER